MLSIESKIIITSVLLWFITHFSAYPNSMLAKWGRKKFGTYESFIGATAFIYLIPIVVTILYKLWSV